jgi:selenide,water dikinase
MLADTPYSVKISTGDIPLINGALELSRQGIASTLVPQLMPMLNQCDTGNIDFALVKCLLDPQTNGGLLVSVAADVGREIMTQTDAVKIGEIYTIKNNKKIFLES